MISTSEINMVTTVWWKSLDILWGKLKDIFSSLWHHGFVPFSSPGLRGCTFWSVEHNFRQYYWHLLVYYWLLQTILLTCQYYWHLSDNIIDIHRKEMYNNLRFPRVLRTTILKSLTLFKEHFFFSNLRVYKLMLLNVFSSFWHRFKGLKFPCMIFLCLAFCIMLANEMLFITEGEALPKDTTQSVWIAFWLVNYLVCNYLSSVWKLIWNLKLHFSEDIAKIVTSSNLIIAVVWA